MTEPIIFPDNPYDGQIWPPEGAKQWRYSANLHIWDYVAVSSQVLNDAEQAAADAVAAATTATDAAATATGASATAVAARDNAAASATAAQTARQDIDTAQAASTAAAATATAARDATVAARDVATAASSAAVTASNDATGAAAAVHTDATAAFNAASSATMRAAEAATSATAADVLSTAATASAAAANASKVAAQTASADVIAARDVTLAARDDSVAARTAAETAATAAGVAQAASETARDGSVAARTGAQNAQAASEAARVASEAARDTSVAASQTATAASTHVDGVAQAVATNAAAAQTSATASQASRVASETARDASVAARVASETARDASVTARTGAEAASTSAATSAGQSQTSSVNAAASRDQAVAYRDTALAASNSANDASTAAAASRDAAAASATTATASHDAAVVARTGAETARTGAETARAGADSSRAAADTARAAAVTAQGAAETAATSASHSLDDINTRVTAADTTLTNRIASATAADTHLTATIASATTEDNHLTASMVAASSLQAQLDSTQANGVANLEAKRVSSIADVEAKRVSSLADVQGSATAAAASAATATSAQNAAQAASATASGAATTATNASTAATASQTAAAASAVTASSAATTATNQALSASVAAGIYPNTAQANLPRGVPQAGVGAITAGSGGTNGSYTNGTVTGSNFAILPKFNYTVAGGALTSVTITDPGLYIGAAPTVGTPSFTGSNLAGTNVALTAQSLIAVGAGYWTTSADGLSLVRYKNTAGAPTDDSGSIPAIPVYAAIGNLQARAVANSQYGHQDVNGNVSLLLENGVHKFSAAEAESFNNIKRPELARRLRRPNLFFSSSIVHHISYGQSLSMGQGGSISSLASVDGGFFDSVMFNANGTTYAGPRAQEGSGTVAQNHASLIPYEERPVGASTPTGNVETPLGNSFRMIKRLLRDEDGILPTDFDYILLGSAPGQSNTAISGLSKGTTPYTNLIADVTYGLAAAQAQGKTYSVDVIDWSQGEADDVLGTTRAAYLAAFQQLYTDLNTDIKAITKQAHDIKMIAYQMSVSTNNTTIALAQLDAAKANPNIIMATASYALEHMDATNAHLAGIGYATLGAYYGLAVKRTVIEGGIWPAMYPRRLLRQGTILEAEWPDIGYPLRIGTELKAAVANSGFSVVGVDGVTNNPIVSVSVVAPRRVRVVLTNALPGKLRYGMAVWGGNLYAVCDLDPGLARDNPLYLPSLTFEEAFA